MPEGQTRVAGLRTGELDVIVPPIQEVKSLQEDDAVEVHIAKGTGQNMFLQFAVKRPPFDDARARRAVSHAINKDMAIQVVYGDLVERQYCPVSRGVLATIRNSASSTTRTTTPKRPRRFWPNWATGRTTRWR